MVLPDNGGSAAKESDMTYSRPKPEALSPTGELLVFAPPLVAGFFGAPLALAFAGTRKPAKHYSGRNWAKRRAYGG
jgi:hypothetical protein